VTLEERLEGARQALRGAQALLKGTDYRGCASRCYYAAYQAMWAAVGEPERKPRWEHFGIIKTFVRGKWLNLQVEEKGPGLLEGQRFALRRLYNLRLGADYRLDVITAQDAEWAIQVTQEIISLAAQEGM